jgi:hypothetical protein
MFDAARIIAREMIMADNTSGRRRARRSKSMQRDDFS